MSSRLAGPEEAIRDLYLALLGRWNARDAAGFAALMERDVTVVGFDGSQLDGAGAVEESMRGIFVNHPTAAYVPVVRGIRFVTPEVAVLRAVAGMVPPGKDDIMPERNSVQSLVAHHDGTRWRIALFHNTPARFDGRPEAVDALNRELRAAIPRRDGAS